jgi:hypothetical protein
MARRESDTRERSVIAQPIATVIREQERMMDAMAMPKGDSVFVVLQHVAE